MILPGSILVGATVLLTVALTVVNKENQRGSRLFLVAVRGWFDRQCEKAALGVRKLLQVVLISFTYIVHQLRAALARAIAPRPRKQKVKRDRLEFEKTNNHLSSMHDHKSDTALTPAQKKRLRNKKLEERF